MISRTGVRACLNSGDRYDAGQKVDWLRANVELGLAHPELGAEFREVLAKIVADHGISS